MSTQPSPLEQLAAMGNAQQQTTPSQPQAGDNLSPLEKLAAMKPPTAAPQPTHYSGQAMGSKVPDSILNGPDSTGEAIAGITGIGAASALADPVVAAVGAHLGKLKAVIDTAQKLGIGAMGWKEARDLYKEFSSGDSKTGK